MEGCLLRLLQHAADDRAALFDLIQLTHLTHSPATTTPNPNTNNTKANANHQTTQVTTTVISILVGCTPVDKAASVDPAYMPPLGAESPNNGTAALRAVGLFWNQDTGLKCFQGPMRWLLALGIIWTIGFCAGFPVAMAALLKRQRGRLYDHSVELQYGFFYNSYRNKVTQRCG